MEVITEYPPLIDMIDAKFKVRGKDVIFSWGDKIYNPKRVPVPVELVAHEKMHGLRQGNDIEGWWTRYCDDDEFRLVEEVMAHAAEYLCVTRSIGINRNTRRRVFAVTAGRLANPLYQYGPLVKGTEGAKRLLKDCLLEVEH